MPTEPISDEKMAAAKAGLEGTYPFLVLISWKDAAAMIARIERAEARVKALQTALDNVKVLVEEYDPNNPDWRFRKTCINYIIQLTKFKGA